jgi:hypothetical protein
MKYTVVLAINTYPQKAGAVNVFGDRFTCLRINYYLGTILSSPSIRSHSHVEPPPPHFIAHPQAAAVCHSSPATSRTVVDSLSQYKPLPSPSHSSSRTMATDMSIEALLLSPRSGHIL